MNETNSMRKLRIIIAIIFGILSAITVIVALCSNSDHFVSAVVCAVITVAVLVE